MYQSDRRVHQRYPIHVGVEYKVMDGRRTQRQGVGRTINISSGGILLDLNDTLPNVSSIELSIQWPFLQSGLISLRLLMRGSIVRVAGGSVAVQATEREFHAASQAGNEQ